MNESINGYQKLGRVFSEWVWFEGDTALLEGQGVCYNWDFNRTDGSAAVGYPERFNRVEVPSVSNAQYFAGVTSRPYAARTGGQLIEIYKPGSVCNVLSGANTTIGVGRLTCEVTGTVATNGYFRYSGLEGEGSCIPFQTVNRTTPGLCLAKLDEGRPSGLLQVVQAVDNTPLAGVMVGGTTLIVGAVLGTGNATFTLADATRDGLRKKFGIITTELTTSNVAITVTTGRMNVDGDTTLASVTFTAAGSINKQIVLEWGGAWSAVTCTKTQPVIA